MVPVNEVLNALLVKSLELIGSILLSIGLYYMGKAAWLTIRGRP